MYLQMEMETCLKHRYAWKIINTHPFSMCYIPMSIQKVTFCIKSSLTDILFKTCDFLKYVQYVNWCKSGTFKDFLLQRKGF